MPPKCRDGLARGGMVFTTVRSINIGFTAICSAAALRASLLAGKLHAILQRSYPKGRDFYDLIWYLSDRAWPPPNLVLLLDERTRRLPTSICDQRAEVGEVATKVWQSCAFSVDDRAAADQPPPPRKETLRVAS